MKLPTQEQNKPPVQPPASAPPVAPPAETPPSEKPVVAPAGDPASPPQKPVRPERLSPDHWDDEKGELKLDALLDAHSQTQTKLGELESRFATVPDSPDKYEATVDAVKALLPADIKLPEDFALLPNDHPVMVGGKKLAHELGIPAADFPKLVAFEVQRQVGEANELTEAAAAQRTLLGEKADARISAVETWLKGRVGEEHARHMNAMLFSAKHIEAFESLIKQFGTGGAPPLNRTGQEPGKPGLSDEEYGRMSPAQKITYARTGKVA